MKLFKLNWKKVEDIKPGVMQAVVVADDEAQARDVLTHRQSELPMKHDGFLDKNQTVCIKIGEAVSKQPSVVMDTVYL